MTDREIMQEALDALIDIGNWEKRTKTFLALRDRLAQPEPKSGYTNEEYNALLRLKKKNT